MAEDMIQAFALGCLSPEEISHLRKFSKENPGFNTKELGKYQNLTALLPSSLPIEIPDPGIKDKIARKLYRIKSTPGNFRTEKENTPSKDIAKEIIHRSLTNEVSERKKRSTEQKKISDGVLKKSTFEEIRLQPASKLKSHGIKFFYIPLALLVGLIIGFFLFYENKDGYLQEINELNSEIETLNSELVVNNSLLNLLEKRDTRIFSLSGSEIFPDGFGKVYVNSSSGRAYLHVNGLQSLSENKTYQLWIRNGNKTFSAGLFNIAPDVNYYSFTFPVIDYNNSIGIIISEESTGGALKPGRKIHLVSSN